jgi:heat shock protein 4
MTKPKPAPKPQTPPPSDAPAPEPQSPEQHPDGATEAGDPTSEGGAQEQPAGEQMDTDKPDGSPDPSSA